jgi:hypothetical protein
MYTKRAPGLCEDALSFSRIGLGLPPMTAGRPPRRGDAEKAAAPEPTARGHRREATRTIPPEGIVATVEERPEKRGAWRRFWAGAKRKGRETAKKVEPGAEADEQKKHPALPASSSPRAGAPRRVQYHILPSHAGARRSGVAAGALLPRGGGTGKGEVHDAESEMMLSTAAGAGSVRAEVFLEACASGPAETLSSGLYRALMSRRDAARKEKKGKGVLKRLSALLGRRRKRPAGTKKRPGTGLLRGTNWREGAVGSAVARAEDA